VSLSGGVSPWMPIGTTSPGASSWPWTVPLNTGGDYCLSIQGMAPGYANSQLVITDSFTVSDVDSDGDGVLDTDDNCTLHNNSDQRDTDGDGYGNRCDGDLNNDGSTNTLDLNLYKLTHRSAAGDANYDVDADFNGDGVINTLDLNIYKGLHRLPPGPSCCGLF
jgi:hypothetical protein